MELQNMELLGVIMLVSEPTKCCSPMVPVTKRNGDVCICEDLKRLNQAVMRETSIFPMHLKGERVSQYNRRGIFQLEP